MIAIQQNWVQNVKQVIAKGMKTNQIMYLLIDMLYVYQNEN
jgi:hypothetical protein